LHPKHVVSKLLMPPDHRWNYDHIMLTHLLRHLPSTEAMDVNPLFSTVKERTAFLNLIDKFKTLRP